MFRSTASLAGLVFVAAIAVSGNRTLADQAFVRVIGDWEQSDGGKSLEQHFRFANDLAAYGVTYTIAIPEDTPPGKCTSPVWAFKTKDVTLARQEFRPTCSSRSLVPQRIQNFSISSSVLPFVSGTIAQTNRRDGAHSVA